MSSSDGFCSTLSFAPGELGQPYTGQTGPAHTANSSTPSANVTPLPTPTHIPPSPVKATHAPASTSASASSTAQAPPASPARSNSASSVATQPNQQTGAVVNNPTPTLGSVPLVTATHSAQPSTLPLTTPPQTPLPTATQGGTSAHTTSSVLGKRDIRTASESEKEESKGPESAPAQQPKKRRVAPTLVSAGSSAPPSSKEDGNTGVGS